MDLSHIPVQYLSSLCYHNSLSLTEFTYACNNLFLCLLAGNKSLNVSIVNTHNKEKSIFKFFIKIMNKSY